jgi:DNA-binding transcriptional LysR family regulator
MNWDDLKILEVCARSGSFLKAAEELGVSHTSVSRRMTQLESDLNITLLHRTSAGISLTDVGVSIVAQVGDMAAAALIVKNTTENASEISGRIHFETIDATAFNVMGYLGEFTKIYPDIQIDLHLNQEVVNLDRGDADVVLRATNEPPEDYVGHHVANHAFGIYGSVDLVNRYPADMPLSEYPWITFGDGWSNSWLEGLGISPRVVMRANTANGLVQAVRAGVGVAHLACYGIAKDEHFVCLHKPKKEWSLQIWLLAHQSMRRNQRVRTFVKFLRQKMAQDKELIEGRVGSPTRPAQRPIV